LAVSPDRSYLISRTAFVSTYAPRRCGIATFTYDLATTVGEREIVALHPSTEPGPYPAEVRHRIRRDIQSDYAYVAHALNDCGVDVVSVQFEPGIWGGDDGSYVLDFVRALRVPMVVTLHSVLAHPTPAQRAILIELVDAAEAAVVMSQAAADLLIGVYGVDAKRIDIVPHGVSDLPLIAPDTVKPRLGLQGKAVILSFGLLAPGKGLESVIEAMPAIVAAVPTARYVILGSTSPATTVGSAGEAYRSALEAQATALGMTEQVKFVDRFVGRVELCTWLEAADVFVSPSLDLDRTVSGTLAYAMGAGKAIVSTPSALASELLANGRGRLVSPSSGALATAITDLLLDPESRASMGRLAYEHSRGMVWWEVGRKYRHVFDRAARAAAERPYPHDRKLAVVVA
jgi:glycosyltransferase involved in cell wall biosynthesis